MSKLVLPTTVFVPFEWVTLKGDWIKRDDIPRFITAKECIQYFGQHPELSKTQIDFHEYSEKWALEEFSEGVGTKAWKENQT